MACPHAEQLARLAPPKLSDAVHREECTQCFDSQDDAAGVDVCLTCFNGGCRGEGREHARAHAERTGHPFTLNIQRTHIAPTTRDENEPPQKMTKLAIAPSAARDAAADVRTGVRCWACDPAAGRAVPETAHSAALAAGVLAAPTSARAAEVQAWEEEITACEHTLCLEQHADAPIAQSGLAHCKECDLKENLWLCLTCGSLGCGRPQYGGVTGGRGHGLAHFEASAHPVSVKLGTITPEGAADIYCYLCNDARLDPELAAHLGAFGISVATQTKTEKSMTELQIEHNLTYDFSLTSTSGEALAPVFGPGLTGLQNLGNSCYMASVLQTLFALPAFRAAYSPDNAMAHWAACPEPLPAGCVQCQMLKVGDGLLSGRYAVPAPPALDSLNKLAHESPADAFQAGLRPAGFKALLGRGHAEFGSMRQQDAEEFLSFLLDALRRDARRAGANPALDIFRFGTQSRLECGSCHGVRYREDAADVLSIPVPAREKGKDGEGKTLWHDVQLEECLGAALGAEELEYHCPACARGVSATKSTRLASFPAVLVLHAKKFQLVNWVPTKLDIPLLLPADDTLILDAYLGRGAQPGETLLPDADAAAAPAIDADALAQLEGMGFPAARCTKALLATGNAGAEPAMEWLFAHMDDPDIDAPLAPAGGAKPEPDAGQVAALADMGFTAAQARKALQETGGSAERAIEWLFSHPDDTGEETAAAAASSEAAESKVGGDTTTPARYRLKAFVSHKGPSVHSGHYVAHIRTDAGWVLFNDEKVVRADDESVRALRALAYLYVFERE